MTLFTASTLGALYYALLCCLRQGLLQPQLLLRLLLLPDTRTVGIKCKSASVVRVIDFFLMASKSCFCPLLSNQVGYLWLNLSNITQNKVTLCWFELYALRKSAFTNFSLESPKVTKSKISSHSINNIWSFRKVTQRNIKTTQKVERKREGRSKDGINTEKGVPPFYVPSDFPTVA